MNPIIVEALVRERARTFVHPPRARRRSWRPRRAERPAEPRA